MSNVCIGNNKFEIQQKLQVIFMHKKQTTYVCTFILAFTFCFLFEIYYIVCWIPMIIYANKVVRSKIARNFLILQNINLLRVVTLQHRTLARKWNKLNMCSFLLVSFMYYTKRRYFLTLNLNTKNICCTLATGCLDNNSFVHFWVLNKDG